MMRPDPSVRRLTPRERDVAFLVADGLSNVEIARELNLQPKTVSSYVQRIQLRLRLKSRAELVEWIAIRRVPGDPSARLRRMRVD
jgi:DNA-binding CsgD family transcriptional regulator